MKHKQRMIAVILSLLMLLSTLPAYAEDGKEADTLNVNAFHEALRQKQPTEIHFCKKADMPLGTTKIADISEADGGGNIHIYADETETKYWVVHEKNEKIIFPKYSNELFSPCGQFYDKLTTITFEAIDTGEVEGMSKMFRFCSALRELDLRNFDTGNVTSMTSMFLGCSALKELDLTSFNTEKVTTMAGMFGGCGSLTSLDLSKFNTEKVINMERMFEDCNALTRIWASEQFVTGQATYGPDMFLGCTSLAGGKGTGYDPVHTNSTYARIDGVDGKPGYFSDRNDTPLTEHRITVENDGNGTASANVNQAAAGTRVTLTATPNSGYHFKEWQVVSPADLTITENTFTMPDENVTLKAVFQQNATPPPTPSTPSVPTSPTEPAEYKPVSLETSFNGKTYSIEGTEEALNGAVKLDVTVDKQGKTHMNFLDKEGNKVKTKGAVKLTMPVKEGMRPPYRIKVNGTYTTYGEENGNFVLILRPMAKVEMKRLIHTVDGKEVLLEGTEEALNGATKIQVEKKPNGSLILHLYNEQGKEIKSKGYVFVEIPIPEGKKPPYKVTVGGKTTTFEETGRGTVAFGLLIK